MAVEVLSKAKLKCICPTCKSTLSFEYSDLKRDYSTDYLGDKDYYSYVICPVCSNQATIRNV